MSSPAVKKAFASVLAAALMLLWMHFNWTTLLGLHERWLRTGEPYAVGYPIVLICLWWLYTHRARLAAAAGRPSVTGLLAFVATLVVGIAGGLAQLQIAQQLMLPASLLCLAAALFGWRLAWSARFVFVLLLGGIPIWDFLVDPLRIATVFATQYALNLLAVPVLVRDFHIIVPMGMLVVEDGCSGLNLLLAAMVLGLVQADLALRTPWRRAAMLLTAFCIGVIDNWLRVIVIAIIGYKSAMQHPLVHDHGSLGWWIFAASLVPFFVIAHVIERGEKRAHGVGAVAGAQQQGRIAQPVAKPIMLFMLILALAAATQLSGRLAAREGSLSCGFNLPYLPLARAAWVPQYTGFDRQQSWKIWRSGHDYELLALTYLSQAPRKKLIYYSNTLAGDDEVESRVLTLPGGNAVNLSVLRGDQWRIVWWAYWVDGKWTTRSWKVKLLQLQAMLTGDPSSALVTLSRACQGAGCQAELGDETALDVYENVAARLQPAAQAGTAGQQQCSDDTVAKARIF